MSRYNVGDIVTGVVSAFSSKGFIMSLEKGGTGFVHVSEISDDYVEKAKDSVSIGDKYTVVVIVSDGEPPKERVLLSLRKVGGQITLPMPVKSASHVSRENRHTEAGFESLLKSWSKDSTENITDTSRRDARRRKR